MPSQHETMMNPRVEDLLGRAGSKFRLVTLGSMRARQINAYYGQLGEGLGAMIPPQVTSVARKPLSIAFEESRSTLQGLGCRTFTGLRRTLSSYRLARSLWLWRHAGRVADTAADVDAV
jgi:DNA-directed RNA polymerase subunit omega